MLLAFDDTDSTQGGCTTHALFAVLQALPGLAPGSLPRLVRLNPNVPWKTRGNGAVVVELVQPGARSTRIGEWRGMEIHASPDGLPATPDLVDMDAVWQVIQDLAEDDAMPALALLPEAPPESFYWEAVQTTLAPETAQVALTALDGAIVRSTGNGRALIGCLAAAAWRGPASSHEFIAYREPQNWGSPRRVDPAALEALDGTGATFHTFDPVAKRLACVPNTPCPVLLGLRGRNPDLLLAQATRATLAAALEPIDAWLLWDTNQASGDHVTAIPTVLEADAGTTVELEATVAEAPTTLQGGHVHVAMDDSMGAAFTSIAFEPTGDFRGHCRALLPGDQVRVTGAWDAGTVRLEKLDLVTPVDAKVANPVHCGKSMKSRGAGAGYRCACGATVEENAASHQARGPGAFEVPVMARRHLHRPLGW